MAVDDRLSALEAKTNALASLEASLADLRLVNPNGPRASIGYYNATALVLRGLGPVAMGGFRWIDGRYMGAGRVPVFDPPAGDAYGRHIVRAGGGQYPTPDTDNDLAAESYAADDTWYVVFACANDGDATYQLKLMPVLRVRDQYASLQRFNQAGEHDMIDEQKTHQFATNGLAGADVLVLTEKVDNRHHAWSGRMTTVTANDQTSATLADIGTMEPLDMYVVAPPGWDHYCQLGEAYYEDGGGSAIGEFRNVADTGAVVRATMDGFIDTTPDLPAEDGTGYTLGTTVRVETMGYISPFASSIIIQPTSVFSTGTNGRAYEYWAIDSAHKVFSTTFEGSVDVSPTPIDTEIPFSFGPQIYYTFDGGGGTMASSRTSFKTLVRGWLRL